MHWRIRQRDRRGASLLEMAMVAAIASIIAAIAIPSFARPTARQRLQLGAQRVASEFRYAAAVARATGTARTVTVNAAARTVGVAPVVGNAPDLRLGDWPFRLTTVTPNFGGGGGGGSSVSFDVWGRPLASGTVTLRVGNNARVVSVNSVTGEVTVQ